MPNLSPSFSYGGGVGIGTGGGTATIAETKPTTLTSGSTVFYKNPESGVVELQYVGNSENKPVVVAEFTGTPANGSVNTEKFAAANIDGVVGVPSARTLLTTVEADNTHAPTAQAVLNYVPVTAAAATTATVGPITSQTILQNVTGLGLTIGTSATEVWRVSYWLLLSAATTTMDAKFGFSVPTGATMYWGLVAGNTGALTGWGGALTTGTPAALLSAAEELPVGTRNGTTGVLLNATVLGGGTAGSVQVKYAQNTSEAANLSILTGSIMEARRIRA